MHVVVGGGVIGCNIAYQLATRGAQVTVIEKTGVACAASGKAGGFLARDWRSGDPQNQLMEFSFDMHEKIAADLKEQREADYGYRRLPTLMIAASRQSKASIAARVGRDDNYLSTEQVKAQFPWIDKNIGGAMKMGTTATTAQVHPKLFTQTLMDTAIAKGAKLIIGSVTGLEFTDNTVTGVKYTHKGDDSELTTDVLACTSVTLCMGPWTNDTQEWGLPCKIPSIFPQKAHSTCVRLPDAAAVTHTAAPAALFVEWEDAKTGKSESPEIYPRPDGEIYICGGSDSVDLPDDASQIVPRDGVCEQIKAMGADVTTQVANAEITIQQACFLPHPPRGGPVIGSIPDVKGLFMASGHSCWGICQSTGTGIAMAELLLDGVAKSVDLTPFKP